MKIKITLLLAFITFQFSIQSQSIFESFDDYTVGDNIGEVSPNFDAWDFDASLDTEVTDVEAFSGSNAIRIFKEGNYTSDLQFKFADETIRYGVYEFKTQMLVRPNKKGYLRLDSRVDFGGDDHFTLLCQYGDCTIGTAESYGFSVDADNKINMGFPYADNEWFNIEITMYRGDRSNTYSVRVNEECVGQFLIKNGYPSQRVGSINFYAVDDADYYLDDVSFVKIADDFVADSHYHFMNLNNRIYGEDGENVTINGGLLFEPANPFQNVSSYEIELDVEGAKTEYSFLQNEIDKRFEYFCIKPDFQFDKALIVSARLSKINGIELESNNLKCENDNVLYFNEVPRERQRQVFVEGFVNNSRPFDVNVENDLSLLQERFPNHVSAVSVHRSGTIDDPLDSSFEYFSNLGATQLGNASSIAFNKNTLLLLPDIHKEIINRIYQPALLKTRNIATLENDVLEVMVELEAFENLSSVDDIAVILTQDNVQGEGAAYNLANIFGTGNTGVYASCKYRDEPAVIPAAEAFYDRIPIAVEVREITEQINAGEKSIYTFEIDASSIADISNYKIISVVRNASGAVENSNTSTLQEALDAEDFFTNVNEIDSQISTFNVRLINMNNLVVDFSKTGNYNMIISNLQGQLISSTSNITSSSKNIDISAFIQGLYIITVEGKNKVESKMFVKS